MFGEVIFPILKNATVKALNVPLDTVYKEGETSLNEFKR
jgi:hypothetical protein